MFWVSRQFVSITGSFLCFFITANSALAQLHPVAKESGIQFIIKNFGFKTGGTLGAPEGDIIFSPDDPGKSSFRITINTESINTDNNSRDEHLRAEDYLDVKDYPQIRFVSSSVRATGKNEYQATGTLTIKNKTNEIHLPFTAEKNGNGFLFKGSFKMNRRDYDVGGSSTLSNELTVIIKVLAQ